MGLLDWLAGGARAGAEPTLSLMRGDAINQPFLPNASSGGRIGAIASALGSTLMPVGAPTGALGAGPVMRAADAALDLSPEARAARAAAQGYEYHRRTNTGPDTGVGYMMFAKNPDAVESYGRNHYMGRPTDSIHADDLVDETERLLSADPDFMDGYHPATPRELAETVSPQRIVDSAGAWDDPGFVEYLWNNIFEPRGLKSAVTNDGMVTFDPAAVRSVDAAFDPARANEADLLASRAGLPTGLIPVPAEDPAAVADAVGALPGGLLGSVTARTSRKPPKLSALKDKA